ncbi:unnamed protein product, partial [Lampetra planeri]
LMAAAFLKEGVGLQAAAAVGWHQEFTESSNGSRGGLGSGLSALDSGRCNVSADFHLAWLHINPTPLAMLLRCMVDLRMRNHQAREVEIHGRRNPEVDHVIVSFIGFQRARRCGGLQLLRSDDR